ncbi:elastinolytic metalloproteinase mep [Colletotrichum kahawae]|uniref:Extracellular metalloproteinase n=1 Tax=Colletotrichum kahawae TaxID=34407 RepID=A0AAD9YAD7_COLKA|nr:elastinolytic metalloproteinase mep [Colletotrichum kahawae]
MVLFSALMLLGLASRAVGHPAHGPRQLSKRTQLLNSYRFNTVSSYTAGDGATFFEPKITTERRDKRDDYVKIATLKLQEIAPQAEFRLVGDSYVGRNGVAHVHFQQTVNGIDVDNAQVNVNILEDGTILSFGSSFSGQTPETPSIPKRTGPATTPLAAFQAAVHLLHLPITGVASIAESVDDGGTYVIQGVEGAVSNPLVKLAYVQVNGSVALAWRVETDIGTNWLHTYIDATTGKEISGVIDYTNTATYEVYPWGAMTPDESARQSVADPEDTASSPLGWHSDGTQEFTTLRGNNAFVTISSGSNPSSPSLLFSYPYSPATTDPASYVEASATQGFYVVNKFHDILYKFGFDEDAGNFQTNNNGKGGAGGDPLELIVQASTGSAQIYVPADGRSPRLSMGSGDDSVDILFVERSGHTGGFDLATVWASVLYEVFWNMVDTYGIGDVGTVSFDANGVPQGARYLLLKLILDSEALMPCSAHHLQARDALLEADQVLTGAANKCSIWKGFARRGFGQDAVYGSGTRGRVDGFTVPSEC